MNQFEAELLQGSISRIEVVNIEMVLDTRNETLDVPLLVPPQARTSPA